MLPMEENLHIYSFVIPIENLAQDLRVCFGKKKAITENFHTPKSAQRCFQSGFGISFFITILHDDGRVHTQSILLAK